jgi:hypothetical protein
MFGFGAITIGVLGGGGEKETDTNLADGRRKKVAHFWPDLLDGVKDFFRAGIL